MTAKLSPSDKVDDIMGIFELFDNDASGSFIFWWGKRLNARGIYKPEFNSVERHPLRMLEILLESMSSGIFRLSDITNIVDGQSLRFFFLVFCEC